MKGGKKEWRKKGNKGGRGRERMKKGGKEGERGKEVDKKGKIKKW